MNKVGILDCADSTCLENDQIQIEMHSGGGVMLNCVRKVHMKTPHNLPYASSPRIVRVGSGTRAAKSD